MKIWIIHQHARPPSKPGHTRPFDYAKALQNLGHEVFIITSSFNHVNKLHEWLRPNEKYKLMICEGVPFLWIKTPGYSGNTVGRIWDMLVFSVQLWRRLGFDLLPNPDIIIGSSPPPFGVVIGQHIASRLGIPFILDVRDLWPETLVQLGGYSKFNPFVLILKLAELYMYRTANHIVTVLPNAAEYFVERGGKMESISWLPNGVDTTLIGGSLPRTLGSTPFVVAYAGAFGIANAIDSMLEAANILRVKGYTKNDIEIRFIGDGPEKPRLISLAKSLGLTNVVFDDPVPKLDVFKVLLAADALILTLKDIDLYKYGMSVNKLYDYMATGRPVIFGSRMGNNPVREAKAGVTVDPEDSRAMAEAMIELSKTSKSELQAFGERGRQYVLANHEISGLSKKLDKIIRELHKSNT